MFLNELLFCVCMFNFTYDQIISKIREEKQISDEEITKRIKEKLTQLSDLISKEGAAHIVANELGVKLIPAPTEAKINRLVSGMNNVTVTGKVVNISDVVSFNRNGREGKVARFLLGDETGSIRVVLWDINHIKDLEDGKIANDVGIVVRNGYVKSNSGFREIHVGNRGSLEIVPNVNIDVKNEPSYEYEKKSIKDLTLGDNSVGIFATVVQIFEPRFYESCSHCGKKLETVGENALCKEHGKVTQELVPVVNFLVDDGTDNIRAVAFRRQAESLLNVSIAELLKIRENVNEFTQLRDSVLGRQLLFIGRVTKNELFDRKDFMIQNIIEVNPEEIILELEKEVRQ